MATVELIPRPPSPALGSPAAPQVPALGLGRRLRAAALTAVFFLEVLPMLPSKPVEWVTTAPLVERVRYPTPGDEAEGDLYRPSGAGPHPSVVFCLGVDHPQVPRLGAALARAGFTMFKHLDPSKVGLPHVAFRRELAKFVRSDYPLFRQAAGP